jgi:hypothetical protein
MTYSNLLMKDSSCQWPILRSFRLSSCFGRSSVITSAPNCPVEIGTKKRQRFSNLLIGAKSVLFEAIDIFDAAVF